MPDTVIDESAAEAFLACGRIAVIGASPDHRNFGHAIFASLAEHGIDTVPVNPNADLVDGRTCYPDIGSVPGPVDGALVAVHADLADRVVDQCIVAGITRIWLFQGLGGHGAVSPQVIDRCRRSGVSVIPGACPLMFLPDAAWAHRLHRSARRHLTHSLTCTPAHDRATDHRGETR